MKRTYEDMVERFGKKRPSEEPYCKIGGKRCPQYVTRGSRCNGRRTIFCQVGAGIEGRASGEVTRKEADDCMARQRLKLLEERARSEAETPPDS